MNQLSSVKKGKDRLPPRLMIYGGEGVGKAQPKDAKVLTPNGFVPIGSVRVGDNVIGSDGKPYNVSAVYPQGKRKVYLVTFRDGSSTRCCDEHLWLTRTNEERRNNQDGKVRKLSEIQNTQLEGFKLNHDVPRVRAVEFAQSQGKLPVDSYQLGLFLGDGCFSGLATIIHSGGDNTEEKPGALDVTVQCKRGSRGDDPNKEILSVLKKDGVQKDKKFIPKAYLHASIEDRVQLLRGLLDCDESVRLSSVIEFSTLSLWLANDLCFLIRSLGGSAKLGEQRGMYSYAGKTFFGDGTHRVHAILPHGIVTDVTENKPAIWDNPIWSIRNSITDIREVGEEECVCICTDAPDSLYVTDDFILTHNSTYAAQIPGVIFIDTEGGLSEINCVRFPQALSFNEVMDQLKELSTEKHEYGAVAIDSCDWLERLVWEEICRDYGVNSIEKAAGGYGKGYIEAANRFRRMMEILDTLRMERNMAIILIAHAKVEPFNDPENGVYDRHSPRLHKHVNALLTEWSDAVLFATRRIAIQNANVGDGKVAKGVGTNGGERILRCEGGPACVAKNRYSLPFEIPMLWKELMKQLTEKSEKKAS